jgi:hypothetical protein
MVLRREKSFVPKCAGALTYLKGCFAIWAAPTSAQNDFTLLDHTFRKKHFLLSRDMAEEYRAQD